MLIFDNINKYENNNALIAANEEVVTYKTLIKFSQNISKNIKNRCLIFLICGNNLESISGYLGFSRSNCVVSMIDERISSDQLNKLVLIYKPDFIFIKKKQKFLTNYSSIYSFYSYELLELNKKVKVKIDDDLFLLISTSGSTGTPKYVRQSYNNIYSNTESILKYLNILETDITITTLPMSYVYGLSILNTHLNRGACIVLNNHSVIDKKFWTLLEKKKVCSFGGVPYTYQILDKINFEKFNLKHLKYTTQAGGKLNSTLSKKIINYYKKTDKKFFIMYGAAEATARMSYLPWEYAEQKTSSVGIPISGGKFWIEDNQRNIILENNKSGELVFSGKNVCLGYANNVFDLSKGDENKGILRTGDIAKKDNNNFYYITGRKDRYVKIHGNRINLAELEYIISDFGIQSLCQLEKENQITIFIKNLNEIEKLKEYLSKSIQLHPTTFVFKKVNNFSLNKNYKVSYSNEASDKL